MDTDYNTRYDADVEEGPAPGGEPHDPTARLTTPEVYSEAHKAAVAVVERVLWERYGSEGADRVVSLVMGAALLDLEGPWRRALDEARAGIAWRDARIRDLEDDHERIRGQRDRTDEAWRHVSGIEAQQRTEIADLEDRVEAARDLAVRLEGELALLHTLAASADRDWLRRWAKAEPADDNAYATQMGAAARLVLAELEEAGA